MKKIQGLSGNLKRNEAAKHIREECQMCLDDLAASPNPKTVKADQYLIVSFLKLIYVLLLNSILKILISYVKFI